MIMLLSFRLLNSEIGNDQLIDKSKEKEIDRFRLLNSEIGNDQKETTISAPPAPVFVSLTRR